MRTLVENPKLRLVDVRPIVQNGLPYLYLRDPLGLTDKSLLVPQPLASVLAFCDGTRDAGAMAELFADRYGLRIDPALVEHLMAALDEVLLLDNQRYAETRSAVLAAYRQEPFRKPALAGLSYPDKDVELRRLLQGYVAGIGRLPGSGNGASPAPALAPSAVRGLVSPHIDFARGGTVYATVWQRAAEAVRAADLVVILGTDHYGGEELLTLTRQNYATPYGVLPTDRGVVDALAEAIGEEDAFAGELRHRGEHSIELVAVWLHHMLEGAPKKVVPVLAGSFARFLTGRSADGTGPGDRDLQRNLTLNRFLDVFPEATAGRQVAVVASGDLAHVGPAFGGLPVGEPERARLQQEDGRLLGHMQVGDPHGFFTAIQDVGDRNNVCGTAPIYLAMRLLGTTSGEQTAYAHCPADETETSVVSVCGVVFG